ncbi:alpha/beta hydrolase [Gordonia sp. CPCC 206044]|uniref:alpha/beta fold hydrolase n=1 Tax=Gordonia sp. CPCC 206044 TaxID=3140793 RepID=UPI003AF33995
MSDSRRAGWLAGAGGIAALGAVAAGGVARDVARRRAVRRRDPHADEDFTAIYRDPATTVTTDDGVELAVRTVVTGTPDGLDDGRGEPELTVVFVHGFSLRMASWHFQRRDLERRWADRRIRMVFFDQRGHGRSGAAEAQTSTISRLADDTAAVLRDVAPTGPVVLVGHSMGGMTIMGLARRYPELFGAGGRIAGVALIATAARGITEGGLGKGLHNPVVDGFRLAVRRAPGAVRAGRGVTRALLEPVLVAASFGPDFYSPAAGRAVEKMIQNTPIETIVNFLHALENHDESTALPVLAQVPSVVVCGNRDRLTPLQRSVRMYGELGEDSALEVADGAGHMVLMEQPDLVTDAIVDLVGRARVAKPRPRRGWWKKMRVAR